MGDIISRCIETIDHIVIGYFFTRPRYGIIDTDNLGPLCIISRVTTTDNQRGTTAFRAFNGRRKRIN